MCRWPASRRRRAGWCIRRASAGAPVGAAVTGGRDDGSLAFLRLPAVWLSFLFFVAYAISLGGVQSFGPQAAGQLHQVPPAWAAMCLTAYMLSSAAGMVAGGYLVRDPGKADRVIGCAFVGAGAVALSLAFPHGRPIWCRCCLR